MSYNEMLEKLEKYNKIKHRIPKSTIESYERSFIVGFTHDSTAIEGNTLTLRETKVILEDGISVGGKSLREIYEVANHGNAFKYVQSCILEDEELSENIVKEIHSILMQSIMIGGIYRKEDVFISGAEHTPPTPNEMYKQIKDFYADLTWKNKELNLIEYSAWTHAEFVRIHPFIDGNGRTSRLIMNYQLMKNGLLPISIKKENRLSYFDALEEYAVNGNLQPFSDMIMELEMEQLDIYLNMKQYFEETNDFDMKM